MTRELTNRFILMSSISRTPTIGQYLSLRPLLNSRIQINKSLTTNVLFCYSGERLLERTFGTRGKGVDSEISAGRLQHHLQTSVNG